MKLSCLFSLCSGYTVYQNVNVETGNVEFKMEPAVQEFERLAGVNPYYA
jgi:hypothetical protein